MLKESEASRNSDQFLTLKLWVKLYPTRIFLNESGQQYILLKDVMDMPREDNVKRIRAKIQNEENKYLPTSPEVRKKRNINESVWLQYCNHN